MKSEILRVNADSPEPESIKKIVNALHAGAIVAVPTETVYGLAADANNKDAVAKLYDVKSRLKDKPITTQISDLSKVKDYINPIPSGLEVILKEFWPGPLTVILKTDSGSVGLRVPDNNVTLAILKKANMPLAVTSANISGRNNIISAAGVKDLFDGKIEIIVDDGKAALGIESTILDCTSLHYKILRQGAISHELNRFLKLYG